MKKNIKPRSMLYFLLSAFCFAFLPAVSFAAGGQTTTIIIITLTNPLSGTTSIMALFDKILGGLLLISWPIISIVIVYGAFQILTAGGEPEKFEKGKRTIIYAVVAEAIIIVSKGLALIIKDFFGV